MPFGGGRYGRLVQKAIAVLAGPLLAVWLFLLVTTPLVAVILMLAVIEWQDHRRRRAARLRLGHSRPLSALSD